MSQGLSNLMGILYIKRETAQDLQNWDAEEGEAMNIWTVDGAKVGAAMAQKSYGFSTKR